MMVNQKTRDMGLNKGMPGVFIGVPCYCGDIYHGTARSVSYAQAIDKLNVCAMYATGSLLAATFNRLFCSALNLRSEGIQYFVLLHSDIWAMREDWLPRMLGILEEHELDVLSVVAPIKSQRGMTSTALDTHPFRPRRLTMKEIVQFPETFTNRQVAAQGWPGLLLNTGLLMIRLTKPWAEQICFTINDRITREPDGNFAADVEPEDWHFSRWCNRMGLKTAATTAIMIAHAGQNLWGNSTAWGDDDFDKINGPFNGPLNWRPPAELKSWRSSETDMDKSLPPEPPSDCSQDSRTPMESQSPTSAPIG
ncbi:MAG: hypothetical protein KIPDCIKN_04363 [Haliscomenobacter sp.]|nr:hypothetical protein [Haliscomenobacter sp.]